MSSIFLGIGVIAITIIVHEFGHLLAAKKLKVPVSQFSIGFGPVIKKLFVWDGTAIVISMFLAGGYVELADKNGMKSVPPNKRWKMAIAGPLANNILAALTIIVMIGLKYGWRGILVGIPISIIGVTLVTILLLPLILIAMMGYGGWNSIGGPISAIVGISSMATTDGLIGILLAVVLVNISIAAINLIPIGSLDGAYILGAWVEGKPKLKKAFNVFQVFGWCLLIITIIRAFSTDMALVISNIWPH